MSHELGGGKKRRIPVGTRRSPAYGRRRDRFTGAWTAEGVKGGLIGFYREIAGVGLVFPRADRPIAVECSGSPVITLHPVGWLEFVEEAVTALGSSGELVQRLFRDCTFCNK